MAEPVLIKIAWVLAVVVVYGLLRWRLMVATHEFRIRAGCEADRLASDPRVSEEMHATLTALADAVYRPATPWIVVTVLAIAVFLPVGTLRKVELPEDTEIAAQIFRLKLRLIFAVVTTSPLACIVAILVLLGGLLFHSSVNAVTEIVSAAGRASLRTSTSVLRHS